MIIGRESVTPAEDTEQIPARNHLPRPLVKRGKDQELLRSQVATMKPLQMRWSCPRADRVHAVP